MFVCFFQERRDSGAYDYANEEQREFNIPQPLPLLPEGHYEMDTLGSDTPFWEPASIEDELRNQLGGLTLTHDTLS